MGENSKIQWTQHTFNPWIGCAKVSAGCLHCYAEADFDKRKHLARWGRDGTRVVTGEAYWRQPLRWDRAAAIAGVRGGSSVPAWPTSSRTGKDRCCGTASPCSARSAASRSI